VEVRLRGGSSGIGGSLPESRHGDGPSRRRDPPYQRGAKEVQQRDEKWQKAYQSSLRTKGAIEKIRQRLHNLSQKIDWQATQQGVAAPAAEARSEADRVAQQGEGGAAQATRQTVPLDHWAVGLDAAEKPPVWHLFMKKSGKWLDRKTISGIRQGRQQRLLKLFMEGGGFVELKAVLKSEQVPNATGEELRRVIGLVNSELSKIGKILRKATSLDAAGPLFHYKRLDKKWFATIKIGYAVKSDEGNVGQGERLCFRSCEHLTTDEQMDIDDQLKQGNCSNWLVNQPGPTAAKLATREKIQRISRRAKSLRKRHLRRTRRPYDHVDFN